MIKRISILVLFCILQTVLLSGQTPGQIDVNVVCHGDTAQQYAVYLPTNYSESEEWPILFVFDPAARAVQAAKAFQSAAETLGYIVMVSHNSRNGPWDPILEAADALFKEAYAEYSIDTNRIYTTGFSGGSRAAILLALYDTQIDGVIGCGAGMPIDIEMPKPLSQYTFDYVGCVGTQDMNFHEHHAHRDHLDEVGITNTLLIFRGPHRWPPEDILMEAMLYLDMKASMHGIKTQSEIREAYLTTLYRARQFYKQQYAVEAVNILSKLKEDYSNQIDIFEANEFMDSIISLKTHAKQLKQVEKIKKKETALQAEFDAHLLQVTQVGLPGSTTDAMKGVDWWTSELQSLKRSGNKSDPLINDMYMRVYRSCLLTFIMGSQNFAQYNVETAIPFNQVWADADSESAWAQYQLAKLLLQTKNEKKALTYLKRAIDINPGYIDQNRLNTDFKSLHDHPKFKSLVDLVSSDHN